MSNVKYRPISQIKQLLTVKDIIKEIIYDKQQFNKRSFTRIPYMEGAFIISSMDIDNMFIMYEHEFMPEQKFIINEDNYDAVGDEIIKLIQSLHC
jgi:hypothetical protein